MKFPNERQLTMLREKYPTGTTELANEFNCKGKNYASKEYEAVRHQMRKLNPLIEQAEGEERELLIKQKKAIRSRLLKIPYKAQIDKKIKYVRYADDFLIGVNGSKEDCQAIKQRLSEFICNELKMELSEEKTLITHSRKYNTTNVKSNGRVNYSTE